MVGWRDYIALIDNGDPVEASYMNQRLQALADRDDYLKAALESAMAGRALIEFDVEVDSSTVPGSPVYIDVAGIWQPAQAIIQTTGQVGYLADQGFVVGIVVAKASSNRGHVMTGGVIDDIDWSTVIEGIGGGPGNYWLSSTEPGKITQDRSSAGVFVGHLSPSGSFFFGRNDTTNANDHLHHRFALTNAPAVDDYNNLVPPAPDGAWDISGIADGTVRGWLPYNHPNLGPAPTGAKFGYNLVEDPELADAFPPVPILGYAATLGRDVVSHDQLVIDANGIWWMDDSYDQVPWPVDYGDHGEDATLGLYFTTLTTDTVTRGVSSLRQGDGSLIPIVIVNSQGTESSIGDLQLSINELMLDGDDDVGTGVAVKAIIGREVLSGPSVDSLEISTAGLIATASVNNAGKLSGNIQLGLDAARINQYVVPASQRFVGAQSDQFNEYTYASLPAGRDASVVYQYTVPELGVPATSAMRMRLTLLGRGDESWPDLVLEYRIITPNTLSNIAVPDIWVTLETLEADVIVDQMIAVDLASTINVSPGSEVALRVSRSGSSDGYTSPVGLVRVNGILEA